MAKKDSLAAIAKALPIPHRATWFTKLDQETQEELTKFAKEWHANKYPSIPTKTALHAFLREKRQIVCANTAFTQWLHGVK